MPNRSYGQYCAFARALDVLGDRWTLLIIRNLLLGPQTWSELRAGLPGIAKNLLSARLSGLQDHGVIEHTGELYALTARGRELEPVVFALGNWGERHFMGPPSSEDAFRLRYLMTSVRRKLRARPARRSVQLDIDDSSFHVTLGPEPSIVQGRREADLVLRCTIAGIRALLFTETRVEELLDDQLLTLRGDAAVVEELRSALRG